MSQQSLTADEPAREAPATDVFDQEVGTPDLVRLYLDEIGKAPLLDAATEVDLAQRIEAGLYARHLLDQLGHRRAVKLREARKVASSVELTRLVDHGEVAKRAFIRANLRLVVSLARRYTRASMPLLDLIQEGNVGLVRAVEKFDYTRGYKFSTYATWWIRQSIGRAIAEQSRTVRLPGAPGREAQPPQPDPSRPGRVARPGRHRRRGGRRDGPRPRDRRRTSTGSPGPRPAWTPSSARTAARPSATWSTPPTPARRTSSSSTTRAASWSAWSTGSPTARPR